MLKVLAAGFLLTALYNFLVFNSQLGIGFSFFVLFINITILVLKDKDAKNPFLSYFFAGLSSTLALLINLGSNGVVQLIDLFSSLVLILLNLYFAKTNLRFDFSFLNFFFSPFKAGLKFVEGIVLSLTPQTWAEHSTQKHVTSSLLRGLFIGVPVLIVFFIILSKADPVFENITFTFLEDVWLRIIFSLVIFVSALSLGILKIVESESHKEVKEVSQGKEYELLVILGGLALLFGGFIFIQFKYLFSNIGERELLSLGIKSLTYSEYVRKGFFELLLASVLSSGVVLYVLQFIHKLKGSGKLLVQLLSSIVTIEVGMMLWSAAQRVFLYQEAHGLTRARVFGMFFLAWLAILLIVLLVKVVKDINNKTHLSLNILSTLLILIAVNIINVDGLMTGGKNRPRVNDEIDYYYLARLSPDAHQSWIPAILEAEKVYLVLKDRQLTPEEYRIFYWSSGALDAIDSQVTYLEDKYGSLDRVSARHAELKKGMDPTYLKNEYKDKPLPESIYRMRKLQAFNMGEYLAHEYIEENPEIFDKLPALTEGISFIRSNVPQEVTSATTLDRSTSPPLSN